jgi:hypothetical protein
MSSGMFMGTRILPSRTRSLPAVRSLRSRSIALAWLSRSPSPLALPAPRGAHRPRVAVAVAFATACHRGQVAVTLTPVRTQPQCVFAAGRRIDVGDCADLTIVTEIRRSDAETKKGFHDLDNAAALAHIESAD